MVADAAGAGVDRAGRTIIRRLDGDAAKRPFRYRDMGTMATISRFEAIAHIGCLRVYGFVGWLMWLVVHLFALTGFKNRVAVVSSWTVAFLGHGRPQRTIMAQQVFARQAAEAQAAAIRRGAAALTREESS
jgi:NADH:quinone reductase (non-electrogenic)